MLKTAFFYASGLEEDFFWAQAPEDGDYELCFINGNQELIRKLHNKDIAKGVRYVFYAYSFSLIHVWQRIEMKYCTLKAYCTIL